ncbi:MAG: alanine--tRNA ligase [Nevskiaceae bacterium]|jgi:alanyl-tRNA synthetase|nr:alanine--tRNA ligase [Nevskiaceae bacterium]
MSRPPKPFSAAQIRSAFLDYFAAAHHTVVASSSLVPGNDPTLLFTNAGMVQFKDVFLGKDPRPYVRAASSQRCVRAGGKHNDLENVGYTARHHTFFEMLGNFSFGDYFKRDAITFAWDFLTRTLGIDPQRLWVTVYQDDDEAADLWLNHIGVPADRFTRLGEKSNFWSMGDTGPCGPCTEIFYDHGADIPGGPPGSPDEDGDRYVEIWNLVFMQFDRAADGQMTPLPKPSVDTGMGLERICAVMQGVQSNYDIDLFRTLIDAAAKLLDTTDLASPSLRVIADHIRACAFLVADGVMPANEGRGYVLRRIMRRAMRHGHRFGAEPTFFASLLPALTQAMGEAYPVLREKQNFIRDVLLKEGEQFARTLATGMTLLDEALAQLAAVGGNVLDGEVAFRLYDTYGFPLDLTADIARERGYGLDQPAFDRAMQAQRERARGASQFGVDLRAGPDLGAITQFTGYDQAVDESRIVALLKDGASVDHLSPGDQGEVVLEHTPFYAESGGQVGDTGELLANGSKVFAVEDTRKRGSAFAHIGKASAALQVGQLLTAHIDDARRARTRRNHTATHLLHAALREALGEHVQQKGSLVAPDRLRFDFAHFQPVTPDELQRIERRVNEQIRANAPAETRSMRYDEAVAAGAMALFGEKYGDVVRVLRVGDFSTELCGGTHVSRAGDIGLFKITSESGIQAGVRRIEAVTGEGALDYVEQSEQLLKQVAGLVRGTREDVPQRIKENLNQTRTLEKQLRQLKDQLASGQGTDLASGAVNVHGVNVLAKKLPNADAATLRSAVDQLKDRLKSAVIVLASVNDDTRINLVAGVTPDLITRIKAGEIVAEVAKQLGGRGGGRADFAQAGGSDVAALDSVLTGVAPRVSNLLKMATD